MEAQLSDVRAELLSLMDVKPPAQFGELDTGATAETPRDPELATRLAFAETKIAGLVAMVDELRSARDAWQAQAERATLVLTGPRLERRPWWRRLVG